MDVLIITVLAVWTLAIIGLTWAVMAYRHANRINQIHQEYREKIHEIDKSWSDQAYNEEKRQGALREDLAIAISSLLGDKRKSPFLFGILRRMRSESYPVRFAATMDWQLLTNVLNLVIFKIMDIERYPDILKTYKSMVREADEIITSNYDLEQ